MLDRKSRQVLKAANKAKNDLNYVDGSDVLLQYLPKKYKRHIIDETLRYLERIGYVNNYYAENTIYGIEILYEGQNYNEFQWIEIKEFIIKSIFIPIFVSVATTLITLFIKKLL